MTNLLRARRAPLVTLQYPLQQPLQPKQHIHQEAAGARRGTNKTISSKETTVEAWFNFLVEETFSLCVPATPCSTTSTSRLTTLLKGGRKPYAHQAHC